MAEYKQWQFDLETYIRQGEPEQKEKSFAWKTAIGLQEVDGLRTSEYLLETAKEHIEGKIDIFNAGNRIRNYYEERKGRLQIEADTMEADIVSVRIAELLGEKTFQFSPAEWIDIHRRLFTDVFDHAGSVRNYNITKKEWVLNGETVLYASFQSIKATLDYDFSQEKKFVYDGLSISDCVKHIAKFTSDIWQIHPFCEGNTRSTAVFIIKYLKTFGFEVNNDLFAEHSWYFRNALVRANYNDFQNNIYATTSFLELFFENLLLDGHHELKNRFLHIDYSDTETNLSQKVNITTPKGQNEPLNAPLAIAFEDLTILRMIKENPKITQKSLAEKTGKSQTTIKRRLDRLKKKRMIQRVNGKRYGYWEIMIEI